MSNQLFYRKYLLGGIALGIFLWVLDAFVDSAPFRDTYFMDELLHPHPVEIFMRVLIILLCAGYGSIIDMYEKRRGQKSIVLKKEVDRRKRIQRSLNNYVEEERAKISREIHDDFAQLLTAIKMQMNLLRARGNTDKETGEVIGLVDELVKRTRSIANSLRPSVLEHFGLSEAIKWLASEAQKSGQIKTELQLQDVEHLLDDETRLALFRVAQEALTNVARHSGAQHATISLSAVDDKVFLSIRDDGKGMNMKQIDCTCTMGITGMRERIELLNGVFNIAPQSPTGVSIEAEVRVKSYQSSA